MKKALQKALSCLMIVLMVTFSVPIVQLEGVVSSAIGSIFDFTAEAADAETVENEESSVEGNTEGISWSFDSTEEKLVVAGPGEIPDFQNAEDSPWYIYRKNIKNIKISEGITKLGKKAFSGLSEIKELTIPDSVISIGDSAFEGCTALETLEIGDSVNRIGDRILAGCSSIVSLKVPFIGSTAQADATYDAVVGYFFGGTDENGTLQFMKYKYDDTIGKLTYSGYYYDIPATFKKLEVTNDEIIPTGAFTNLSLDEIILSDKTVEISDYALHKVSSVGKLMIFNKSCVIKDRFGLITLTGTIYGYADSEVKDFALSRDIDFVVIDETLCPHFFSDWQTAVEPTCEDNGTVERVCSACYYSETRSLVALGHDYSENWETDKEADCTEDGSKSRHCTRCSATTDVTVLPALGHKTNGADWTVEKEATCVDDGLKVKRCERCSEIAEQEVIEKIGHSLSSWRVRRNPTCERKGQEYRKCRKCSYEKTRNIAALGHSYSSEWTTDVVATCTEDGYKSHHCQICDKQTDVTAIEATGHNFVDSKCTVCEYDRATECECRCHETGIRNFFFKLGLLFQRMFGKNKECACGAAHY